MRITAALSFSLVAGIIMCSGNQHQDRDLVKEGWVDDITFRAKGVGVPKHGLKDPAAKVKASCAAALSMAQFDLRIKLGKMKAAAKSPKEIGYAGIVKKMRVVKETYDPVSDSCEVVIETSAPGLKGKSH